MILNLLLMVIFTFMALYVLATYKMDRKEHKNE